MKYLFSFLIACLVLTNISAQTFPVTKVKDAGDDAKRINFVFVPDGYVAGELPGFLTDVTGMNSALFDITPYKEYADFFNVHMIEVPSNESGANHPGDATDVTEPASPIKDVDNYFDSKFDYANIHRLLYPVGQGTLSTVLANNYPGYDQAILVVNDTEYGGAGGWLATTSLHPSAPLIAIHEVGHSFAGLADEYNSGANGERPNRTSESDPALVKWSEWVGENGVGVYPIGSGTNRPHQSCMMRFLNSPFCSVCTERTIDVIYDLVTPIDDYLPVSNNVSFSNGTIDFSIVTVKPDPNTLVVEWLLDGVLIHTGTEAITVNEGDVTVGMHTLVARVTDNTSLSKSYAPASGYVFERSWIFNAVALPVEWLSFDAKAVDRYSQLDWRTASERDVEQFMIERSKDGKRWETIGQQKATGTTDSENAYQVFDYHPKSGSNYYRIKEVSLTGEVDYSPIRQVKQTTKWFYKVFPNPTNGPIALELYTNEDVKVAINIYDMNGVEVVRKSLNLDAGNHRTQFNLSDLPRGTYSLKLTKGDWMETFLVEKK